MSHCLSSSSQNLLPLSYLSLRIPILIILLKELKLIKKPRKSLLSFLLLDPYLIFLDQKNIGSARDY